MRWLANYWRAFTILAVVIGFIVDWVAFVGLVGIEVIVLPSKSIPRPSISPIYIELPVTIELITFLFGLYGASIIYFILAFILPDDNELAVSVMFYLFPFYILIPVSLAVWFWVFGYVPHWLYVFLAALFLFIGIVSFDFIIFMISGDQAIGLRNIVLLLAPIGPVLIWFQANYGWALPWTFLLTIATGTLGFFIGFFVAMPLTALRENFLGK